MAPDEAPAQLQAAASDKCIASEEIKALLATALKKKKGKKAAKEAAKIQA